MVILYKILSFCILPIAVFVAMGAVFLLPFAFSNPILLMSEFLYICLVIYTFTSFKFLNNVIVRKQQVNRKLQDWIKVNSIPTLLIIVAFLFAFYKLYSNDGQYNKAILQTWEMMKASTKANGDVYNYTNVQIITLFKSLMVVPLIFSILYLIHILLSFKLLKQYKSYFVTAN